ncbi:MAG: hypothetical protein EA396_00435 [Anaerolineaceae bacterium]|nr:MAG: hypothetical protein EA396_00435 [Anaerolineaceae bacterium]
MIKRLMFLWLAVVFGLVACGDDGGAGDGGVNPVEADPLAFNPADMVIQWPETTDHILFRADVTHRNAEDDFFARTGIPPCTIYGDGRVVWTTDAQNPIDSVLVGPVDEPRIRGFISNLTLREIYRFDAQADIRAGEDVPVVETLVLDVNDVRHVTDIYGGWNRPFFNEIVTQCRNLSPRPQIFRPTALWLRVQEQDYNYNAPAIIWDAAVTGINLAAIADSGQPAWIEGRAVDLLWAYRMRSPLDLQYTQGQRTFVITVEIPGITRFSPPAP